jgi:hypothetical protein
MALTSVGRIEQDGAGLRGEELSWRHERLDQLQINDPEILLDRFTNRPSTAVRPRSDAQRALTVPELLAYDLEQILR